ncbi:23S rRNA pseudouridine(955/2504/2580) synthase RluC [Aliidiomarina sedimenti]|uniref:Pseudouridine synthase n=3 Tax=Idiomarinaceae TaxID=267893 RepID=A0A432WMN2_9GAMM|nr:23S rRNA pseudouridine(955/2504/2580) synthase RluC [Aliidiomarina sedimenti]RUO35018.1 23S rRNA pseudouridine(955/2504/2580) synthase RluC [Aliidiomarina soli]
MRAMNESTQDTHHQVRWLDIDADMAGQRIDNFLRTQLKGVPKSMIYRILRKGEVRVNKKRIKPDYKLQAGDQVRVPPVRVSAPTDLPNPNLAQVSQLTDRILYEDDYLLVVNKPAGMAVHGGSGISFGLIEALRSLRGSDTLELVHRLDRETSGCLLVAKKRSMLRLLNAQLREKQMKKIYLALVQGEWSKLDRAVTAPLRKQVLQSGERMVRVDGEGKPSETRFKIRQRFAEGTLVQASPVTGRTHQIRVHTQAAGHPIAMDDKYGDQEFSAAMRSLGLQRLFLHAETLSFYHPKSEDWTTVEAPLDAELVQVLDKLTKV